MIEKTYTDRDGDVAKFFLGRTVAPGDGTADERNSVRVSGRVGTAYLTDANLRELRDAIDEHLGDRPKPVEEWRPDSRVWQVFPEPEIGDHLTRINDVVIGLAEAYVHALKKETEK